MNRIEGFADKIGGAGLARTIHGALGIICAGYDNDRQITDVGELRTSDPLQQAETIQIWHGEIGNHKGNGRIIIENFPGVLTIDGFDGFEVIPQDLAGRYPDNL
jgi:hypothetical protein